MTLKYIQEQVEYIESVKGDDEIAHGVEDSLREAFISHVAEHAEHGEPLIRRMAQAVLKTKDIQFKRWCA